MKLFSGFNSTFNTKNDVITSIWNVVKHIPTLNGLYISDKNYLTTSYIGTQLNNNVLQVKTWYNAIADTNYLYSNDSSPYLIENDSKFNNQPSINFNNNGDSQLLFKYPISIGTLIIVYFTNISNSYLVYAPRVDTIGNNVWLHYDAFPSGNNLLWGNELLTGSSIYNATSRINGRQVFSNDFVPLNNTRILVIKDIANQSQKESVYGFGGQAGQIGGVTKSTYISTFTNSVKGAIAAIITFEDNIDIEDVENIELELARIYVNYKGVTLSTTPSFKYLVNSEFIFDFSTIAIDEWYNIESFILVSPLDTGLSFTGSVLSGYLDAPYFGELIIDITNSANITSRFNFNLEVCKADPIIALLPDILNLNLILSSDVDSTDNSTYGIYTDTLNRIVKWEDARRINVPSYYPILNKEPLYENSNVLFNSKNVVSFNADSYLQGTNVSGKTFIWVYLQTEYGNRFMLDTFPDIYGDGRLWTVENNTQNAASTDITQLTAEVNKLNIDTYSYKLVLNKLNIIVARQFNNKNISFTGLKNMRGKLALLLVWSSILDNNDINNTISLLAEKYFTGLNPVVVDNSTVYKTTSNVEIHLKTKIIDILNLPLTYTILSGYNTTTTVTINPIIENDILKFNTITDGLFYFEIECTNSNNLATLLIFYVSVLIRNDALYLDIKRIINSNNNLNLILLPTLDTLVLNNNNVISWEDYRLVDKVFNSEGNINISYTNKFNNKASIEFASDGSSSLNTNLNITGKSFIVVYIKKLNTTGRFFLFGQEDDNKFASGINNSIFDTQITSTFILNSNNYVNNSLISNNYKLTSDILNVIVINSSTNLSFQRIAKDRVFTDSSVKGYIGLVIVLENNVTENQQSEFNAAIRNYYDPAKYILLLHLNNNLLDSSGLNKNINNSAAFSSTRFKFGGYSLQLVTNSVSSYLTIPNNGDFAFLYEDFTISFWLAANNVTNANQRIIIYAQTSLYICLSRYNLYVSTTTSANNSIVNHILPSSYFSNNYSFFHVEVTRVNKVMYLFLNGVLVKNAVFNIEINDAITDILIGQSNTTFNPSNINLYIDEIMVYRRLGFHTTNFTPPVSQYI